MTTLNSTSAPTNRMSVVSLVAGIASYVILPFIAAVVGVITGHISLKQIKQDSSPGKKFALAGLILSYINIAISIVVGLLLVLAIHNQMVQTQKEVSANQKSLQTCLAKANAPTAAPSPIGSGAEKCLKTFTKNLSNIDK